MLPNVIVKQQLRNAKKKRRNQPAQIEAMANEQWYAKLFDIYMDSKSTHEEDCQTNATTVQTSSFSHTSQKMDNMSNDELEMGELLFVGCILAVPNRKRTVETFINALKVVNADIQWTESIVPVVVLDLVTSAGSGSACVQDTPLAAVQDETADGSFMSVNVAAACRNPPQIF
jgi:hypothetical protein